MHTLSDEDKRNLYFNWEYLHDGPSCQRSVPETWTEKAAQPPNKRRIAGSEAWAIGIGTAVFSVALIFAVWIMSCNNNGRKRHRRQQQQHLQQEYDNGAISSSGGYYGSLPDDEDQASREIREELEEAMPLASGMIQGEDYCDQRPKETPSRTNALSRCCSLASVLLLVPIVLGAAAGFTTIYYPQSPLVNLCSDEVDWVDSLKSLLSEGSIQSSFHTLFSVYNPNRYDAYVLNAIGTIETTEGVKIGNMTMADLYLPSYSVMDVMTNTTFQLEDQWEAWEFVAKYYRGTLALVFRIEMEIGVGSGRGWMGWTRVPLVWTSDCLHITSSGIEYKGELPYQEGDRHLCKCPT
uniref:Late embryogenesis abundant protein LEA-2 subgroup domain-containing protein n=1 Tax=Helicotheca tamesis TaxID=374047 RepID=A0A7S2MJM2_9STRA|mmetsp:Transcript_17151/g.23568  ORF Transcript_17151/g.23568 Transcript_17151/m.23568 type:complete len:351 (+) Transcript_17151:197-1249(+)|eukprot:CAMPEP_0185729788 /NCGR_PEP_ID=MMETSP1171-20130828/7297_1 /TAXON_ID=374046 /ORGANISM="Helicotheca tamensis, Strain CCMP826" /LENGTH=350 /DNA_ID=CAMNT_0028398707 /DNA_START=144 /DNA_END=1196 /DNA_ORIENTATION=+